MSKCDKCGKETENLRDYGKIICNKCKENWLKGENEKKDEKDM